MRHENLPATIGPEPTFELERQVVHGTLAAPENGFPHFEGYNLVYIQQQFGDARIPHNAYVAQDVTPIAQTQNVAAQQPQVAAPAPVKRRGIIGRDAAIWICVLQLGVIIWWLMAQGSAQRVHTEIKNFFAANGPSAPNKNGAKQIASNSGVKHHTARVQNRFGKSMVPPPPPGMPIAKMMVPPPPVAYSLDAPGPGAVAASTLNVPKTVRPAAGTIDTADSEPVPTEHANTASIVPVENEPIESASAESTERPAWMEKMPTYPSWADAMDSKPTQVAQEQQQPAIRTVMNGSRKRTIADR